LVPPIIASWKKSQGIRPAISQQTNGALIPDLVIEPGALSAFSNTNQYTNTITIGCINAQTVPR
jgi:hypothetical protein